MRLREVVLSLKGEVGEERASRTKVVTELQTEMDNGSSRVTQLEDALRQCQVEVEVQVARMEREETRHGADLRQAERKVKEKVEVPYSKALFRSFS